MRTLAVIWRAAGLVLATDAATIVEVLPPVASRPMPGAPAWIRGVFVHRGELIPLVGAERLISGLTTPPTTSSSGDRPLQVDRMRNRVLVVRIIAAGEASECRLGLWVESILELARVEFTGAGTHPGFVTEAAPFLGPVASTEFGLVQLVKAQELFTPEQLVLLTHQVSEAAE